MSVKRGAFRGFSLTDLTVATAGVGLLLLLAAPALKKGQAGVDVRRCQDNLRQLSMAQLTYANVNGGFPPMALARNNAQYEQLHPDNPNLPGDETPGGWYDGHGWYSLVGPYIGEPAWAALMNLNVSISSIANAPARRGGFRLKVHACPADIGLQRNEWPSQSWASVLSNYVVNAGNTNYGQGPIGTTLYHGAPFARGEITPLATITDGLFRTVLMSEKVVIRGCIGWSGLYADTQRALGGQMFTGHLPPNPQISDGIGYGRNGNGLCADTSVMDARYQEAGVIPVPLQLSGSPFNTYLAARSKHPGGVNASMCDGSVGFVANTVDPAVWRALSTSRGAGSGIPQEINPSVN